VATFWCNGLLLGQQPFEEEEWQSGATAISIESVGD